MTSKNPQGSDSGSDAQPRDRSAEPTSSSRNESKEQRKSDTVYSDNPATRRTGPQTAPRYDDRPASQGERGTQDEQRTTASRSPSPAPGMPKYGDADPDDPRRLDVDSRRSKQSGEGDGPSDDDYDN